MNSTPAPSVPSGPTGCDSVPQRALRVLPAPGESLGPYRLISELASGGMATIYVAVASRRAGAHRLVAVKRLHAHLVADSNYRKMFLDEAQIASQIRHPNVCAVFDYDEQAGTPYIVMEYLVAESISTIWKALPRDASEAEKRRRATLAARIVADVCEALHAAHELRSDKGEPLNVVHRDVSPENLLVTYDGAVKLCDFGIATAEGQEHRTEAGMLKGKYAYIPPEVLLGQRPDRRSDIWSLGVVLWELATGERLFRRNSALETIQAVAEGLVPAPSAILGVASELDAVVLRALSSKPDERFADARDFGKALNSSLAAAGCHAGLGEVAEWMEELFPGGRAEKEHLLERVATAYEPAMAAPRWLDYPSDEEPEARTLAIDRRSTTPPLAWPVAVPTTERADPRWRRPVIAFALGVLVSARFLSPAKAGGPGEREVESSMVSTTPLVRHATRSAEGSLGPDSVETSGSPRDPCGAEQALEGPVSCAGELLMVDVRSGAQEVEKASTGRSTRAIRETPEQHHGAAREPIFSRPMAASGARGLPSSTRFLIARAIPPVRPLELSPKFAAYTAAQLARPDFLVRRVQ